MCNEGYAFDINGLKENKFLSVHDNGSLTFSCPILKDEKFTQFLDSFTLPQCGGMQSMNPLDVEVKTTTHLPYFI